MRTALVDVEVKNGFWYFGDYFLDGLSLTRFYAVIGLLLFVSINSVNDTTLFVSNEAADLHAEVLLELR